MTFIAAGAMIGVNAQQLSYPKAPESNTVDNYFGISVPDKFRPLENDTAAATLEWVKAENAVTEQYLSKIPFRDALRKRLTELNDYRKTGLPTRENDGKYYFFVNNGLQNQSVLYRVDKLGGKPEVFLDPNTLSTDGTVALTGVSQSPDGRYTAYTISRSGSDWTEIFVMDTATGALLPDHIQWAKFTSAVWYGDGFYYSAYPRPEKGKEFSNANENHQIYYHRIGTPQSDDVIAYSDPEHPLHFHSAYVPEGTNYLFVLGGGDGFGESLIMKDLATDGPWITLEATQKYEMKPLGVIDGKLYMLTSHGAERYRLVAVDLEKPQSENWTDVIAETDCVLSDASFAGDKLLVTYEKDAANHIYLYSLEGTQLAEIKLPTYGTVRASSSRKYADVFYSFNSYVYPSAIYSYDVATNRSSLIEEPEIKGINLADYVTEQVFYTSTDGTKIPMFLTYKKGMKRDGKNPVLLYGYGGFNISLPPSFSANRLLWLENGGVYAVANLRGGGEYGESWHTAGTKMNKMNVFNDFISAANYLIDQGWTKPEHLAIEGGSNGGLLVGATVNLRPELFKVAIPKVGVMDMMRYHLFTIGWNWASDYGTSADSKEMAQYILNYSPLHTIRNNGTPYPAILITTADHDDRVVPAHSFKYAAALQEANTGNEPKLIRIDSNAGHGGGKPMSKVIDENADCYSFIFYNMGIDPTAK
ncbi:MAG: prolyl oligopeptidase family serine peptidase [Firmicutes bacterium]|nr:prolyl oligopeptidase family serine peptidase [Bacillota bacterium]MCM1402122.1 prolyl oligopeptidase family serine peptidase [Bacteroides sp.]MCM1478023.1 prolyl oligopeptidase family serine peptidase [Bacteroides sp.]